jgi:hypothetical protein
MKAGIFGNGLATLTNLAIASRIVFQESRQTKMTKFIVRIVYHGTKIDCAISGRTPESCILKARKFKNLYHVAPTGYIVYERKSGIPVHVTR